MWPALEKVARSRRGSRRARRQVATRSNSRVSAVRSAWSRMKSGLLPWMARVRRTERYSLIAAAARTPWPMTSPTTSSVRSWGSASVSNQSPPTSAPEPAGR